MKYFIVTFAILIAGTTYSQSKKKQIEILQHQLDSVTNANSQLLETNSELLTEYTVLNKENTLLRKIMKGYVYQIDSLVTTTINLEERNAALEREKLTSQEKSKEKKANKPVRKDVAPSSSQQARNPFGNGGTGSGNGPGFGSGEGVGSSDGRFSRAFGFGGGGAAEIRLGKGRERLNNVSIDGISIEQDATICYKLTIDEDGNIVHFTYFKSSTTTTDQTLINKIGSAIKQQVRYSKSEGSPLVYVDYTVVITAN